MYLCIYIFIHFIRERLRERLTLLHHPRWFCAARHTFLTHIPLHGSVFMEYSLGTIQLAFVLAYLLKMFRELLTALGGEQLPVGTLGSTKLPGLMGNRMYRSIIIIF